MRMETPTGFPTGNSFSTFSALHLLRNYNQFLLPSVDTNLAYSYTCSTISDVLPEDLPRSPTFSLSPLLRPFQPYPHYTFSTSDLKTNKYQAFVTATNTCGRRPRGEKKPIPEDQKDDRYYERRKRNNQAAKKSRDARKLREDQIALRATLLEHENAVLRAQLLTLREETESLRQLILSQKNPSAVSKVESSAGEEVRQRTWTHGKDLNKF